MLTLLFWSRQTVFFKQQTAHCIIVDSAAAEAATVFVNNRSVHHGTAQSQTAPTCSDAKYLLDFLRCLVALSKKQSEKMRAKSVLQQHLEHCEFPLVHICSFAEIPRFPSEFPQMSFLHFFQFLWEWKRLDWDLFKWRIPSLGCGGVSGTQVLVYHLTSGIFQLLSHQGQHFHVEKKKSQMQMPSNLKRKKRFLTKKLEDCSNILTDMHQITDMH